MTERRSFLHLLLGYKWRHFFVSRVEPTVSPTTNPIAVGPEPVTIVLNKVCLTTLTSIRIVSLTVDELVPVCQVRLESCWCLWGLAWWSSGQDLASLCRGHGFNPWVRTIPWRRKWQPNPVFLPGESHGQRSLVGYSPRGHRVGHN